MEDDESFDDLAKIERDLKNRVRKRLGMPNVEDLEPLTNAQWARENGLEHKYDMPESSNEDEEQLEKHSDEYIQTLLKPRELMHKLSGLKRYTNTDINETGVNTFYAAFGFLERYESEDSSRPLFAPLVLLQLDQLIEKKTAEGFIEVSIEQSGEDPQYNLPLAEKLKEFNLELPPLSEEDSPESYMSKVENLIKHQRGWRVRRFITIGRFQFARLVMYHDLDPNQWPYGKSLSNSKLIRMLISGEGEINNSSGYAEVYDIDKDPEVEEAAPILIMEADSSQHSAIVDALKGKNLVIKGPPGTGKSQTITNLIANAIAKEKKVLFIAEKMAALNVVYSRLQSTGLGNYCLELHSTKTKLKDIKERLATTIELRKSVKRPRNLKQSVYQINGAKNHLRVYSDALNQNYGRSERTIHDIFWGEQIRRQAIKGLPVAIKKLRIEDAYNYTDQKLDKVCDELKTLARLVEENNQFKKGYHPWQGVEITNATSLKANEIFQAFEESEDDLKKLDNLVKSITEEYSWNGFDNINDWNIAIDNVRSISNFKNKNIDFTLLQSISSDKVNKNARQLSIYLDKYDSSIQDLEEYLLKPEQIFQEQTKLKSYCEKASTLKVSSITTKEIQEKISNQIKLNKWVEFVNLISRKTVGIETNELNIDSIRLILQLIKFAQSIDRDTLYMRSEDAMSEANKVLIQQALEQKEQIQNLRTELQVRFDLNYELSPYDLDQAIYNLSSANILSYFQPSYYRARKLFRTISIEPTKINASNASKLLRQVKKYKTDLKVFSDDPRYKQLAGSSYNGLETDFSTLLKLNEWAFEVRREFSGLEHVRDKIKSFLFKADLADIDAIKLEAKSLDVDELFKQIKRIKAGNIEKILSKLKTDITDKSNLQKTLEKVQKKPDLTYDEIASLLKGPVESATQALSYIHSQSAKLSKQLGSYFDGIDSDRVSLSNTIGLSDILEPLGLPEVHNKEVYSKELFSFMSRLELNLNTLASGIFDVEKSLSYACEISELNKSQYTGLGGIRVTPIKVWLKKIRYSLSNKESLNVQLSLKAFLDNAKNEPYGELLETISSENLSYTIAPEVFDYLFFRTLCDKSLKGNKILDLQSPIDLNEVKEKFKQLDKEILSLYSKELAYNLAQSSPPEGISSGRVSSYTQMGLIRHQALKEKSRPIPIRRLISRAGRALQELMPCFLMSPLSVAQYIAADGIKFDLVVIDEASQMKPEDALGAIARSGQIVVVGDPNQLPPTTFFSKQISHDSDYEDEDKIDNESILDLSLGRFRPTRDLLWHYRSRHESLIAYSNSHFYNDRLIVFPSPEVSTESFGVSYKYIGGTYNSSRNIDEVKAVVEATRKFMQENPGMSLGIATMNSQQRDLIYDEMYRLFLNDEVCEAYRRKWETEEGGLEPFFVKNLESVQGDERDTIFISTVYGPDKNGRVMQRFGPINGMFGHRRLNVLFTRAKHNLVLFTSLRPDDIKANQNSTLGLKAFKGYLEYASSGKLDAGSITNREPDSDFEIYVMEKLQSIGCEVVPQVGVNGYYIDLGVKHPDYLNGFLLGIECDGAMYHSSKSARDRDRIRQEVLEGLGWDIYRIWSTDWFHNPNKEFEKLKIYIEKALSRKNIHIKAKEEARLSNVIEIQQKVKTLFTAENTIKKIAKKQKIDSNNNIVEFHDTVTFEYLDDHDQGIGTVTIVQGPSDVSRGVINQHSAIGRALIGSEINEEVEVNLPKGSRVLLVKEIRKHAS